VSDLPNIPSPPTWSLLSSLCHITPQRGRLPTQSRWSGLRHLQAGSPVDPAVSSSLSYGLLVHLPLLSTSPYGNAVTVSYRPEYAYLERTCTSPIKHHHKRTCRHTPCAVAFRQTALRGDWGSNAGRRRHTECACYESVQNFVCNVGHLCAMLPRRQSGQSGRPGANNMFCRKLGTGDAC
jgi:hypothetical protein